MSVKFGAFGNAGASVMAQEVEQKKAQMKSNDGMWRFYMKCGEEARVTFIDGELDDWGVVSAFFFPQHTIFAGGKKYLNFVCIRDQETCPFCESGNKYDRVAALTIIDHREYASKKDPGKIFSDQKRLFICKPRTWEKIQFFGAKRGGIAGCTFDLRRSSDAKSPNVGDEWDFVEKNDVADLRNYYSSLDSEDGTPYFSPAKYREEITYFTQKELADMGYATPSTAQMADNGADLSGQL